uniref:Si:ch211-159i8.4 n=1 Tax=Hucho hucho TaxID=62062 RepID=A0A4W5QGS6_9TELE
MLSKLRNRYRQAQLDRISQLGKRVTTKPKISHPTPRPHYQPPTPSYNYWPVPPTTSLPVPTNRPYSTASVLYSSRWHYSHWGPRRLSTALPFPNLMGSGVKPRITSVNTVSPHSREVPVYLGKAISLDCVASGKPQAQISWILPDRTFVRDVGALDRSASLLANGTLRIQSANFSSKGDYRCIASNAAGADTVTFHIHVAALPPTINEEASESIVIQEGRSVYVHCTAKGAPAPVLKWTLPAGVHVKPSHLPDGTMINNALQSDDSGTRSRRYDEGDYTCHAKNELGEDEMKVSVKVGPDVPRITSKAQLLLTARLGESAYMTCQATGEPPPTIVWLSPSNDVITSSSSLYQILDDGTLVIKKVTLADQGKYACVARSSAGDDIKNIKIQVEPREPHINEQGGRSSMKVLAVSYQTTLLDCRAEGKPEPHVSWAAPYGLSLPTPYLGGRFQVHKNGSLELRGVRKTDEGQYVCLAKNNLGEASLAIELEVASIAEKPSFAMPNIEILPIKQDGSDVTLECPARGKPNPEFVWILPNGTALTPGTRLQHFTHYRGNGTLRIAQPVTADKGVYRCLAKNVAGTAEKRYALEPGRKPVIRGTTGGMKITFGQILNLPCSVDGWPQASITWTLPNGLVLDKPQVIGRITFLSNGTLQLREVATFDRGTYVCKATNTFGSSALSYPVAVMVYPPSITNAPPSITRVHRGSPVTLNCIAAGLPNLVIQDPVLMNSGIYKCNAKNVLGSDFKATYLQEKKVGFNCWQKYKHIKT